MRAAWLFIVGAGLGAPMPMQAQFGLVTLPLDDPAYVQLAALERGGCAAARVSVDRPYEVRLVRVALVAARIDPACQGPVLDALARRFALRAADTTQGLRLGGMAQLRSTALHNGEFAPLWADVRPTSQGDPPEVGVVHGRLTYGDADRFTVVVDGFGQTDVRNDPTIAARRLRHTSGALDFSEAYATARAGAFSFTLGRGSEAWLGDGNDSQILSANGPPIDRLAVAFHTAHFEGRAIFGSLDDVVLDSAHDGFTSTLGPQRFYRYLAGHMLAWRPSRAIELTIGETALLAEGSPTVDLYYINPFIPYQFTQHDSGQTGDDARDNLTAFGAVRVRLGRMTAAAELLVDDIQIDAARRLNTPDQLGFDLSLTSPLPVSVPATVTLEYQRLDSYTYMREFYSEVYQLYNEPLGSSLGPDADYARLAADVLPVGWLRLAADIGVWRRGLQRIDERPGQEAQGNAGAPFPTMSSGHPVQNAVLANASIQLLTVALPITANVQLARITDVNNLPTSTMTYGRVQLYATYAFRYP